MRNLIILLFWVFQRFFYELKTWLSVIRIGFGGEWEDMPIYDPPLRPIFRACKRMLTPAIGWYAVYGNDEEMTQMPLVCWEISFVNGEPYESNGLVFLPDKPPFVERADSNTEFRGYQYEPLTEENQAKFQKIGDAYEEFHEWS